MENLTKVSEGHQLAALVADKPRPLYSRRASLRNIKPWGLISNF